MSDHPQITNGHDLSNRSNCGAADIRLVVLAAVACIIFLFVMAFNAVRSRPATHSIFFVVLLGICIVASIVLDIKLFEHKRGQSQETDQTKKPAYHPNLRIWAVGIISGIGATIIYLMSVVTLSLVRVTSVTQQILYQYALLLIVLTIGIAFTIWGIVQVCRGE